MVLQKSLYYGFNGYQAPPMPRGSRSARGKRTFENKNEEKSMCGIEMLAMVASNMLLEKETPRLSSTVSGCSKFVEDTVKQESWGDGKQLNVEPCDRGSCNRRTLASENCQARKLQKFNLKESPGDLCSVIQQPVGITVPLKDRQNTTNGVEGTLVNLFCMEDPLMLESKLPSLDCSDSSVGNVEFVHSKKNHGNVEFADGEDDDQNYSRCTIPSTIYSKAFIPEHAEDRKIKKLAASKFWKIGPSLLMEDIRMKPIFQSRRINYTCQRSQRSSFKRKKSLERGSALTSIGVLRSGATFELVDKECNKEASSEATDVYGGKKSHFKLDDYPVKFSIRSFKVPEISIEMPETETIGALKGAVLEALSAILNEGIGIGVMHQGKKVKDDNKTLLQAGIPNGVKSDTFGFSLEPVSSWTRPQPMQQETSHFPEHCESESLTRSTVEDTDVPSSTQDLKNKHAESVGSCNNFADKQVTEPSGTGTELAVDAYAKALMPVAAMTFESLPMFTLPRKSRRSQLVQRRIRRPFSVTEVEALVQAVEHLGTGRWRDVKIRAFDDANHRTYVDLKDKWKTLVHTARIAPQQRRGEPVPQALLDRVLAAHDNWTGQQAKPLLKAPAD